MLPVEAERLMSFTNNSSPLFMLVAVAVGMFNNPGIGILIAYAHYLSTSSWIYPPLYAGAKGEVSQRGMRRGLLRSALSRMLQVQREKTAPSARSWVTRSAMPSQIC